MRFPSAVVLELTYKCNHSCIFCSCPWYAPHNSYPKGKELSLEEWQRIISLLYEKGVEAFSISGGEAILYPYLEGVLRHIRLEGEKRGLSHEINLISNGLALTETHLNLFKELDVHLSVSLPGFETFEKHTGVNNSENIISIFKRSKALGLNTTVNVTVTKLNYHELFETISYALINGANSVLINRFLPGGRGLSHMEELLLNRQQINGMLDTVEEILTLSNRYGYVGTEIPFCLMDKPDKYKRLSIGTQCAAAKKFFVIDPSGKVRTCNHSPQIVGNILDEDPIEDKEYWFDFANSNYKPSSCRSCAVMNICDCGCREVAHILCNSYKVKDPCIDS